MDKEIKIPKDWEYVSFGNVIQEIGDGGTPSTKNKSYFNGDIPWVNVNDIQRNIYDTERHLTEEGLKSCSAKLWKEGTIIFSFGASIGKVGIARTILCTKQGIAGIISDTNKIDNEYLYYVLLKASPRVKQIGSSMGSTIKEVRPPLLKKIIVFPKPKFLQEQKAIANILKRIDDTIDKVDEVIKKTEKLRKGLMNKLMKEGIGHKEFKETPIGKIPKKWDVSKVGDLLDMCQYGLSIKMGNKGKYPIIRMDEIENGFVSPNISKYVNLDQKTFENFKLEKGDILFNRTNSFDLVGRTGAFVLDGDYVFASYLIRLKPKRKIVDSLFLTFYFMFAIERLRRSATKAVHQANINANSLQRFIISLPPIDEQNRIVDMLLSVYKKMELEKQKKDKLERIKTGLMNDLLTGNKRIKVD